MPEKNYSMLCDTCKKKHHRFWVTQYVSVLKKGDGTISIVCDRCGSVLETTSEQYTEHYEKGGCFK